jgi:hypothetical protein
MNERKGSQIMPAYLPRFARTWGLSPQEWYAYERDMAAQDDYDRWIADMEEASAAGKQTADLNTKNNPF